MNRVSQVREAGVRARRASTSAPLGSFDKEDKAAGAALFSVLKNEYAAISRP